LKCLRYPIEVSVYIYDLCDYEGGWIVWYVLDIFQSFSSQACLKFKVSQTFFMLLFDDIGL